MHRGLRGAKFTAATLAQVRRRGWAATRRRARARRRLGVRAGARARRPGLAAVSVSGPIERLTRSPGRLHAGRGRRGRGEDQQAAAGRMQAPTIEPGIEAKC